MKNFLKKFDLLGVSLLSLLIFVLVNLLIASFSVRLDFSKGKVYTLSQSSKKILHNLNDLVTIKFFVSSDIPTKLIPVKNQIVDLLHEYQKENRGKVSIKVLDPKTDKSAENDARDSGLPQLQFSQLEQNKYAVTSSYFGIVISFTNKKEILPQVADVASLEYNLTATIYKMTRTSEIKIAVFGQQEDTNLQTDTLSLLKRVLRQQFTVDFVDKLDSSYKTVFVFDTKKQFSQEEIDDLNKYLKSGGKVIFFVDGVWINDNLTTGPAQNNLQPLFSEYGISVNPDLVLSTSSEIVNFGGGLSTFVSPYYFWLKTNNFNSKTSYFGNISQLSFPWVSSLTLDKKAQFLIATTKRSWLQKDNFILDPQNIPLPKSTDFKQYIVAAQSSNQEQGTVVVIPSSRFVQDRFLSQTSDNPEFVLNLVNDFASGGALSGISRKELSFYPLPDITDSQKNIFKYTDILLLPLLFGLYGFYRLIKRG